jgi:hypothetical protein
VATQEPPVGGVYIIVTFVVLKAKPQPVTGLILKMPALLELHVPPGTVSVKHAESPLQTLEGPVIVPAEGHKATDTTLVMKEVVPGTQGPVIPLSTTL